MAKERLRGTTLAELLVAVLFLAVCVTGIVECVMASQRNANYMRHRALALSEATAEMERAVADAKAGTLTTGVGSTFALPSLPGPGQYVRKVAKCGTYTRLYTVIVTLTWKEPTAGGPRNDSIELATVVRCPDG